MDEFLLTGASGIKLAANDGAACISFGMRQKKGQSLFMKFAAAFRRKMGMTPMDYRNRN